jgi:hypothetical protein
MVMRHLHRSPVRLASLALLFASVLVGARARPVAAQLASIDAPVNPVVASRAWDETTGYGALEASRAALTALIAVDPVAPAAGAPVDPRRVQAALGALQAGDLGGLQEAALEAVVAEAQAWEATSGYGALEATRAGLTQNLAP